MLFSFILAALAVLLSVCIVDAIVRVPEYHFGVAIRFGNRTGKIYFEGFGVKIPFIDKVELISTELMKIEVHAFFTTGAAGDSTTQKERDKLQMQLLGSTQYRPSPHVKDEDGRNVFISVSDEVINDGIADILKDLLGGLGGIYQAEDFIGNRQAFGDFVNQILKFATPFHLRHCVDQNNNVVDCRLKDHTDQKKRCEHPGVKNIPREDLIAFYNTHWEIIREERVEKDAQKLARRNSSVKETPEEEAKRLLADMSPIEKRYGINIETFAIEKIDFSDDIKKAFEVKRVAKERQMGFVAKMEMAREAMKLNGASAQEALDAADVSLIPEVARSKRVISVQGKAGVLGGALDKLSGNDNRRQQ